MDVSAIARELNIEVYISTAVELSRASDGKKRFVDVTEMVQRNAAGTANFDAVVATAEIVARVQREVDRLVTKHASDRPFVTQPAFAAGMLWMATMDFVSHVGEHLELEDPT